MDIDLLFSGGKQFVVDQTFVFGIGDDEVGGLDARVREFGQGKLARRWPGIPLAGVPYLHGARQPAWMHRIVGHGPP